MGEYYLFDNPPRRRQFYNPRRPWGIHTPGIASGVCVIHTAENVTDLIPPDYGAENVARFISNRTTPGSYHRIVDSDSIVKLVPFYCEAFHDATGTNRHSTGFSVATRADQWHELPDAWVVGAIDNLVLAVQEFRTYMKNTFGVFVPAKRITAEEARNHVPGFISHAELDPDRRSDPGRNFPWLLFFNKLRALDAPPELPEVPSVPDSPHFDWMADMFMIRNADTGGVYLIAGNRAWPVPSPTELSWYEASGIPIKNLGAATFDSIIGSGLYDVV